jgi:hypothetical protein
MVGIIDPMFIAAFCFRDVPLTEIVGFRGVCGPGGPMLKGKLGMVPIEISGSNFSRLFAEGVALAFGSPRIFVLIE